MTKPPVKVTLQTADDAAAQDRAPRPARRAAQVTEERPTPYSGDAEKGVLSCFFQNPSVLLEDARQTLPPEAFHHPCNRQLYEAMLEFRTDPRRGEPDLVTFGKRLIDRGIIHQIGGPGFLAELLNFVPTPAHYPWYKGILKDTLAQRQIVAKGEQIINSVYEFQGEIDPQRAALEKLLSELSGIIRSPEPEATVATQIDEWQNDWHDMVNGKKKSAMPSRWPGWNNLVGGVRPGYTIISGTSSGGKSTLLCNLMADACINRNRPGLLFSYEMPVRMVISRLVADIADVDGMYLFSPDRSKPTPHITSLIAVALDRIRKSRLRIVHQPQMSAEGVCALARNIFQKHNDIVVGVDYLQLVPRPSDVEKGSNREREVAVNSSRFRVLSKELDRPVLALSQLSEDGTTRESKAINMDCDDHFSINRYKEKEKGKDGRYYETDRMVEKGIRIVKNRNGVAGVNIPLFLNGPKFRFEQKEDMP